MPDEPIAYPFTWRVRTRLPDRFGQKCRILMSGRMWTAAVEFEDGYRVVTSRRYLRRAR